MGVIELDQSLIIAGIVTGIVLALSTLVIAVCTRRIQYRLLQLDVLQCSIQRVEEEQRDIVRFVDRMSDTLPGLSGLGLHLRQLKRDQLRLSEKLSSMRTSAGTFEDLALLRHHIEKRNQEISRIAKGFRGLQEWKSRVSAISHEARHLFESEPIRELMDNLGSRPDALTAEPPGTSERTVNPRGVRRAWRAKERTTSGDESGLLEKRGVPSSPRSGGANPSVTSSSVDEV